MLYPAAADASLARPPVGLLTLAWTPVDWAQVRLLSSSALAPEETRTGLFGYPVTIGLGAEFSSATTRAYTELALLSRSRRLMFDAEAGQFGIGSEPVVNALIGYEFATTEGFAIGLEAFLNGEGYPMRLIDKRLVEMKTVAGSTPREDWYAPAALERTYAGAKLRLPIAGGPSLLSFDFVYGILQGVFFPAAALDVTLSERLGARFAYGGSVSFWTSSLNEFDLVPLNQELSFSLSFAP